jgi:SAM-dependent methyltransferase
MAANPSLQPPRPTGPQNPPSGSSYDASFYEEFSDVSNDSAVALIPVLKGLLPVQSVLDTGCGLGSFLREFQRQGVTDLTGIEGEWARTASLLISPAVYRFHDLQEPFDLGRRFDLVLCLEVAEHLEGRFADALVATLVRHGDAICFSAAIPGQGGTHHVNEQWPDYWVERFRAQGYDAFDLIRPEVYRDERVALYYSLNTLLYAKRNSEAHRRLSSRGAPVQGRVPFRIPLRTRHTRHPWGARAVFLANLVPSVRFREWAYLRLQRFRQFLSRSSGTGPN